MSNKHKVIMTIITAITLIGILIALFFLPDTIPIHFGVEGASNVSSKYCLLFFIPVPAILYWGICNKIK